MRHPEHRDQQLADDEPEGRPQPAAAAQQPYHRRKQRRQHHILHDPHTGNGRDQQQRSQPNEIPMPVPRVGEGLQLRCVGALRPGGPILFYVPLQVVGQRLKVIDVVGRVRHHGSQRRGLVGGSGLGQHDGVGIIVHLEQLEAEIFRVQPLTCDGLRGFVDVVPHPIPRQGVGRQQQHKQCRQRNGKRRQCPQGKGWFLLFRVRHGAPLSDKKSILL